MGRRRRNAANLDTQLATSKEELERAQAALRYRKAQLEEAREELTSLQGVGGWIPAMLGKRASHIAESQARISALTSEILACRKRLIEAQQTRKKLLGKAEARKHKGLVRDEELERFAERVRDSQHALKDRLLEIEDQIEIVGSEMEVQNEALTASTGLTASMAALLFRAQKMRAAILFNVFGSDMYADFDSTRAAKDKLEQLPDAVDRFNDACLPLGLKPLDLSFPKIDYAWGTMLMPDQMDHARTRQVLTFLDGLKEVRDLVTETVLWVTSKRKESKERYEALMAERRALLDDALG